MVIKTASPGIVINEVDLTRGTSDAITTNVAAFAGPFEKGPVDELQLVTTEAEFQRIFGDPTEENYEYWYTVSNFLEYGGVCYVIRCDDLIGDSSGLGLQKMRNATTDGLGTTYVKNRTHYEEDFEYGASLDQFIARNPGTWGNGIGVAVIDSGADYNLALKKTDILLAADGTAVTDGTVVDAALAEGTTVGTYVQLTATTGTATLAVGEYVTEHDNTGAAGANNGEAIIVAKDSDVYTLLVLAGSFDTASTLSNDGGSTYTSEASAVYPLGTSTVYKREGDFKVSIHWAPNTYTVQEGVDLFGWAAAPTSSQKVTAGGPAGDTAYVYMVGTGLWTALRSPAVGDLITDGTNVYEVAATSEWYDDQIAFAGIPWYRFAGRPGTSLNATDRGASNDELNIIVYDSTGELTGSKGNTLETYFGVSKLTGAKTPEGDVNFYIDVINNRSAYLFAGTVVDSISGGTLNSGRDAVGTPIGDSVDATYVEVKSYILTAGDDNLSATLGELQYAYNKLTLENVTNLDYILQGPGMSNLDDSVAKANFLISVCEERKDCMALLSPPRYAVIGVTSPTAVTANIVEWAKNLSSSSYAAIDSGYKYTYDRYNDVYRYLPLNGDIAGLLVNTSINAQPWFSPAGLSRGQIRNVVKLAYNPSKTQRDELYTNRVNPVVTFPGEGTILFGDKTALGYSSAFDRINVRRLFLVIEREIAKMSRTTLFEFNDETTRSLFKNNVNPYLRDVQAKRGMYDFLVVCDETNNPAEIIDRNEIVADIYIKPSRSVNFISLNFIATKTGVSFDESVALFRGN